MKRNILTHEEKITMLRDAREKSLATVQAVREYTDRIPPEIWVTDDSIRDFAKNAIIGAGMRLKEIDKIDAAIANLIDEGEIKHIEVNA